MKKLKVSLLALAVVAGGAIGASAATTDEGVTFQADIKFASNAPLSFIDVFDVAQGAASFAISNANFQGIVDTDGSGKIEGSGFTRILFPPFVVVINTNPPASTNILATGVGDYNVSITGNITTKNNLPSVQESLKGTGYSSSPTNAILVTGNDGTYVFFRAPSANSSSFSVKYTGNASVVSNLLAGNYKGTIKPGKSINNGQTIQVNEGAVLFVDQNKITDLDLQIVKFGNKFWANTLDANFNGSGNISSSGKATANFKGLGSNKGSSFKLTAQQGNVIIIIGGVTNTVAFLNSVDLSGKIDGQAVSATGATVVQIP